MQFLNPSKEAAHDLDPLLWLFSTLRLLQVQRPQPLESPILSPAICLFRISGPSDGAAFFSKRRAPASDGAPGFRFPGDGRPTHPGLSALAFFTHAWSPVEWSRL